MADILKPDLCIIGAGAPGIALAIAARGYGASVVLIDVGLAGDSISTGAVPGAALAAAAAHAHAVRNASVFGMTSGDPKPNFRAVREHVQAVIAALAPREAPERLKALGIELINAPAAFADRRTLMTGETIIRARRFVIATGSLPRLPEIENLAEVPYFTTDTIFGNTAKLSHLVVLGGGAVALELAQSYRRLGCDVSVVAAAAALPEIDPELAELALRRLREEGVTIHDHCAVTRIVPRGQGIGVPIRLADGSESVLDASHILVAQGRVANFSGLALDKAGIRVDRDDATRLLLRPRLLTSNGRVHVIGEAAGSPPSMAAARHDVRVVLESALFKRAVGPAGAEAAVVIFTDPQLAQIGLSEPQAKQRLKAGYRVIRASFAETDRAIATRRTYGAAKVIADRNGVIRGASLAGPEAGELIGFFSLAINQGIKLPALVDLVMPYPSFAGVVTQLVEAWQQQTGAEPWRARRLALVRRLP